MEPALTRLLVPWLGVLGLPACVSDTYCQSGAKYGTQCYSAADVHESQRQQGRALPLEETLSPARLLGGPPPAAPSPPPSAYSTGSTRALPEAAGSAGAYAAGEPLLGPRTE